VTFEIPFIRKIPFDVEREFILLFSLCLCIGKSKVLTICLKPFLSEYLNYLLNISFAGYLFIRLLHFIFYEVSSGLKRKLSQI
jgi:hypothetical protein